MEAGVSEPTWGEFRVSFFNDETVYIEHEPCGEKLEDPKDLCYLDLATCMDWARAHDCPRGDR